MRVSSGDFIKDYGTFADQALVQPITITKDGRDRLVLVSAEEYERLRDRDRRAFYSEELTAEDLALIANTEMSHEQTHLDGELGEFQL